jgi:hypothetical protein
MKKILSLLLIVIFLANIGQAHFAKTDTSSELVGIQENQKIKNINRGEFTAEIGVEGEEEPTVVLDGNYRFRWRFTIVFGLATNGEREVRFQGIFIGSKFMLQVPLRGRIINILGRFTIDENKEFSGNWIARGTGINGWIEGTIS